MIIQQNFYVKLKESLKILHMHNFRILVASECSPWGTVLENSSERMQGTAQPLQHNFVPQATLTELKDTIEKEGKEQGTWKRTCKNIEVYCTVYQHNHFHFHHMTSIGQLSFSPQNYYNEVLSSPFKVCLTQALTSKKKRKKNLHLYPNHVTGTSNSPKSLEKHFKSQQGLCLMNSLDRFPNRPNVLAYALLKWRTNDQAIRVWLLYFKTD